MANYDPKIPLLSFIFAVYTDPTFQAKFKKDPEAAMDEYKLSTEQKVAIYHSGADPLFLGANNPTGYPIFLDPGQVPPNPVTADWWAAYARYRSDVSAGVPNPVPPPSPLVNDRVQGDRASMAGVMTLLGEELSRAPKWGEMW